MTSDEGRATYQRTKLLAEAVEFLLAQVELGPCCDEDARDEERDRLRQRLIQDFGLPEVHY